MRLLATDIHSLGIDQWWSIGYTPLSDPGCQVLTVPKSESGQETRRVIGTSVMVMSLPLGRSTGSQ